MNDARPIPYPADTRAKGWRFEIDHERVRQSDTWTLAAPDLRPWLLMLWMTAWEQTPCGSLPNDDELIAARIGMTPKLFAKHRAVLMRKWWPAEDGRLYHDVVVQRVLEMNVKRDKDAARRASHRGKAKSNALVTRDNDVTSNGQTSDSVGVDGTKHLAPSTSTNNKNQEEVVIAHNWLPSEIAFNDLEMLNGFSREWVDQQVPSFIRYWNERGEELRCPIENLFTDHCVARSKLRSVS